MMMHSAAGFVLSGIKVDSSPPPSHEAAETDSSRPAKRRRDHSPVTVAAAAVEAVGTSSDAAEIEGKASAKKPYVAASNT